MQDCRKGSPNAILSFKIEVNSQKNKVAMYSSGPDTKAERKTMITP